MNVKKAAVVEGEVSYRTVTCSSCGQEIPMESAERFVIGTRTKKRTYGYTADKMRFKSYTEGWACEHCREHDPVGYPQSDSFWKRLKYAFGALP